VARIRRIVGDPAVRGGPSGQPCCHRAKLAFRQRFIWPGKGIPASLAKAVVIPYMRSAPQTAPTFARRHGRLRSPGFFCARQREPAHGNDERISFENLEGNDPSLADSAEAVSQKKIKGKWQRQMAKMLVSNASSARRTFAICLLPFAFYFLLITAPYLFQISGLPNATPFKKGSIFRSSPVRNRAGPNFIKRHASRSNSESSSIHRTGLGPARKAPDGPPRRVNPSACQLLIRGTVSSQIRSTQIRGQPLLSRFIRGSERSAHGNKTARLAPCACRSMARFTAPAWPRLRSDRANSDGGSDRLRLAPLRAGLRQAGPTGSLNNAAIAPTPERPHPACIGRAGEPARTASANRRLPAAPRRVLAQTLSSHITGAKPLRPSTASPHRHVSIAGCVFFE